MATIVSVTYNNGSGGSAGVYTPGDPVIQSVDYQADTPSVVPSVFNVTTTITDAAGTVTATDNSSFTVNTPQAGDKAATSDADAAGTSHTWTEGATTPQSDGSLLVTFTTTA